MIRYVRRLYLADKLGRELSETAERVTGGQAHQQMPALWPIICKFHKLYKSEGES